MDYSHGSNNKGKKEVECEEPGEGGVINREAASDSLNQCASNVRDGREEVSDDGGPSERHLSSGEDVAYEGGHYC